MSDVFVVPSACPARRAADALAAAAALAAGTHAYGSIVAFTNDAAFEWKNSNLDITLDSFAQTAFGETPGNFEHRGFNAGGFGQGFEGTPDTGAGRPDGIASVQIRAGMKPGGGYYYTPGTQSISAGDLIDSSRAWVGYAFSRNVAGYSDLPEGKETYIGVRFDPGDGFHNGWIKVQRLAGADGVLRAIAWGYETAPGVAIRAGEIPAPGTLAALAFGAIVAGVRPKREQD